MYTHLRPREDYEARYDSFTVELCRMREDILRDTYKKGLEEKVIDKKTGKKDPEAECDLIRVVNLLHYFQVEMLAGERWEERTSTIERWMADDDAKDEHLRNARLTEEPVCKHCGKTGLRITSKHLASRDEDYDNQLVLFMLDCTHCGKRTAFWEDGTIYEPHKCYCPKCKAEVSQTTKRRGKVITDTYSCPACGHSYKETLDLSVKEEKGEPDQYWEEDFARFVISDEKGREYLEAKRNLEGMKQVVDKMKEREANRELYDAVAALEKINIGQLTAVLQPVVEKVGYTELRFDKPDMGRSVTVEFNCLDGKPDRTEYDSRKQLKKTVTQALESTNWRLSSDGISYRLGYLNGRLRAYEGEAELMELVKKSPELLAKGLRNAKDSSMENTHSMTDSKGRKIIL